MVCLDSFCALYVKSNYAMSRHVCAGRLCFDEAQQHRNLTFGSATANIAPGLSDGTSTGSGASMFRRWYYACDSDG